MKWDGHTHSPFCPHGSKQPLTDYIERAIQLNFNTYSITEHAPLPGSFVDPVPGQDSAMKLEDVDSYLEECYRLKETYQDRIEILVGFEVDYIVGYEEETKQFLNQYGPYLEDSILSVHFLPIGQTWSCVDYSANVFEQELLPHFFNVDELYLLYYQVLEQAIKADLGSYKPQRVGHFSLIEKFKKKFPSTRKEIWWKQALKVLDIIKAKGYQLDYNTAGYRKEDCQDRYPSDELLSQALSLNIPFVFGSDAHHPQDIGFMYEEYMLRKI